MKLSILPILFIFLVSCDPQLKDSESPAKTRKIKGVTYTGPARGPIPPSMISSASSIGTNFIAYVPEATLYRQNLKIHYRKKDGWFGESMEASIQGIRLARKYDMKVMLKPHLTVGYDRSQFSLNWRNLPDSLTREDYIKKWRNYVKNQPDKLRNEASWRGYVMVQDERDWETLADNYTGYILDYARLADSLEVEMFCIGTELKAAALEKPNYWKKLIHEVRQIYDGELTYAANWDSYDKIEFWDQLDYIGVDAYFPLSPNEFPELPALLENWLPYKKKLKNLSEKYKKPILFTEWGYESEDFAAEKPWDARGREFNEGSPQTNDHINLDVQATLYEATFQSFWKEPWFAGLFVWRWSPPGELNRGIATYNYSPIGKPAEKTLENWFMLK